MNPELSPLYNLPDPLLPGTISPAILDRAWDALSLGPCGMDSETVAALLSLVADAAIKINYEALASCCIFDAELFYWDAATGDGLACTCHRDGGTK